MGYGTWMFSWTTVSCMILYSPDYIATKAPDKQTDINLPAITLVYCTVLMPFLFYTFQFLSYTAIGLKINKNNSKTSDYLP